jgi:hypothetical protein
MSQKSRCLLRRCPSRRARRDPPPRSDIIPRQDSGRRRGFEHLADNFFRGRFVASHNKKPECPRLESGATNADEIFTQACFEQLGERSVFAAPDFRRGGCGFPLLFRSFQCGCWFFFGHGRETKPERQTFPDVGNQFGGFGGIGLKNTDGVFWARHSEFKNQMIVGRLNMMTDSSLPQAVDHFAYGQRIPTAPHHHNAFVSLMIV